MLETDRAAIHSSQESNWRTPDPLYKALEREFNFRLDAAATMTDCKFTNYFGPDQAAPAWRDALKVDWTEYMLDHYSPPLPAIFLNPPFSRELNRAYTTGRIKVGGQWVDHEVNADKAAAMEIENWAQKCWEESRRGCTIVAVMPFAPQTGWYRQYVYGHGTQQRVITVPGPTPEAAEDYGKIVSYIGWNGHAAQQERRLPHRISFLKPDGTPTGNAGVNSAIIVWAPMRGVVGPWQPHGFYWSYRG